MKIKFEYADNVNPDKDRERVLTGQTKMWFAPMLEELEKSNGTVDFFLKENSENRVSFNNMDKDLEIRLYERLKLFQPPQ